MNVNCNKCGKRYVIADDKIAGKASVKIRCKQCQNLIQVTGPGSTPSQPGGAYAGAASVVEASNLSSLQESPPPAVDQWFAMIAGKQEGPFDVAGLKVKIAAGEVTPRTYLWKPGMDGWKRSAEVPEVSGLLTPSAVAAPPKPPPAPKADTAVAAQTPAAAAPKTNGFHPESRLSDLFSEVNAASGSPADQSLNTLPQKSVAPAPTPKPAGVETRAADTEQQSVADEGPGNDERQPSDESQPNDARQLGDTSQVSDPFAALSGPASSEPQPMGEATKFFIAQAGVNKRNPPWKIALFVLSVVVAPATLLYLLSTLKVLPTVTVTTEDGREVQEEFFSTSGISGLKDMLTGEQEKKKAEAEALRKAKEVAAAKVKALAVAPKIDKGEPSTPPEGTTPVPPKPSDPALAAFYGEDDGKKVRVPKDRMGDGTSTPVANSAGLSNDAAMKIIADKKKAFDQCIEAALRRNPNLAVGNVTVTLTVGSSGAVKAVGVTPKKFEGSDWAQCMMLAGKRIIFPTSDGDTDIEVPLKVGVTM